MFNKFYIRKAIFTAFLAVCLISIGAAISATSAHQKYESIQSDSVGALTEGEDDKVFYIRSHGEIIGVFEEDGDLIYTVNVYIKTLPAPDRAILNKGITAIGHEELYEILGDYDA